mgnify:CR=1 FL=1
MAEAEQGRGILGVIDGIHTQGIEDVDGVAWRVGKHDRPWGERPVLGKVRYMNAAGLRRKFDMGPYLLRFGEGA